METTEYKCLQSQFSVLYNESMQMKTALDDTRLQLQNAKNLHMRQIEMMEVRIVEQCFNRDNMYPALFVFLFGNFSTNVSTANCNGEKEMYSRYTGYRYSVSKILLTRFSQLVNSFLVLYSFIVSSGTSA